MQRNNIISAAIPDRAFFNNSDDVRITPSEPYRDLLIEAGCEIMVHDPHVFEYFRVGAERLKGMACPVIVDGRNVVDADEFVGAGFVYKGIGRGDKNGHLINDHS